MQRKLLVPITSKKDAISSDDDIYGYSFSMLYKQVRLKLKRYPFLWLGVFIIIVVFATIYFRFTYVWEHTSFGDSVRPVRRKACIILNLQDNINLTAVSVPGVANENRFDWKNYLQLHGDLPQNGIVDKKSAWNHWKNYGIKEKRQFRFTNDSRLINEGPLNIGVMIIYESSDKRARSWSDEVMESLIKNRQSYCDRHGYTLINANNLVNYSRPASWSKLVALQYHFKENNFDYIFYLDMDGIIMNQELKLETIIDATERKYDFIVTSDQYGFNVGTFIAKNTPWTLSFLQLTWQQDWLVPDNYVGKQASDSKLPFGEQRAIHYLTNSEQWIASELPTYTGDWKEIRSHFFFAPPCAFNSYVLHPFDFSRPREQFHYVPRDFLIHFDVVEGQTMALQNQLVKHFLSKTQGVIPVMNINGTNTGTKSTLVSSLRLQRH